MIKKDLFLKVMEARESFSRMADLDPNRKTYQEAKTSYENINNRLSSILGETYEWKFVCYDENMITIKIYDSLFVDITIYEDEDHINKYYTESTIYNVFTDEFDIIELAFEKSLKRMIDNIWELVSSGKLKRLCDYVNLVKEYYEKFKYFQKLALEKIGDDFLDYDGYSLEPLIIEKLLNLS